MQARKIADYSVYALVRVLICLIQTLPLSACAAVSRQLGRFCWHVLKLRRDVVEENLRCAFPELSQSERDRIALAMWEHLLLMVMEIAHAPRKVRRTNWRRHSAEPGMKSVLQRLIDERPTVLISGHVGNFEMGGYMLALHGFPMHTVARPLDNPYLDRFVTRFRESTGQYMLPKQGSGRQIALLMEKGGTISLLGDQHAGANGCWVDFFGRPASTHKAVAVFTLSGKAPTAVCASLRGDRPLYMEMHVADIVDPSAEDFCLGTIPLLTEWYTRQLEGLIRQAPQQYWWVHRRWKGQPADRRELRRLRRRQQAA
ncbi:MAG: hypothetical protein KDA57_09390 [Planctomycetales bacterium]|nr:hypothetical protein [Planctomycetales bacterium]